MKHLKQRVPSFLILTLIVVLVIIIGNNSNDILIEGYCKMILILISFVELIKIIKWLIYEKSTSNKIKNSVFLAINFFALLFFFELIFLFVPISHGVGFTKASRLWFEKYWKLNSEGYRENEFEKDKPYILFVGDSFTAGHGIKKPEDRFSNLIAKIHPNYQSVNIGINGLDTEGELNELRKYIDKRQSKPELIVLQYYGNDIENISQTMGITFGGFQRYNNRLYPIRHIFEGSHFLNYLYWKFIPQKGNEYIDFLAKSYSNKSIFNKHMENIGAFINYSKAEEIELVVVVFPFLNAVEFSDHLYVKKVCNYLQNNNTSFINVSENIKSIDTKDLIVNNRDPHPSVYLHNIVSELIAEKIKTNNYLNN